MTINRPNLSMGRPLVDRGMAYARMKTEPVQVVEAPKADRTGWSSDEHSNRNLAIAATATGAGLVSGSARDAFTKSSTSENIVTGVVGGIVTAGGMVAKDIWDTATNNGKKW